MGAFHLFIRLLALIYLAFLANVAIEQKQNEIVGLIALIFLLYFAVPEKGPEGED